MNLNTTRRTPSGSPGFSFVCEPNKEWVVKVNTEETQQNYLRKNYKG